MGFGASNPNFISEVAGPTSIALAAMLQVLKSL